MSKKKKKKRPQQRNRVNNQPIKKENTADKSEIIRNPYQSNDGKKMWVKVVVLLIATAMIIGIIAMPLMSIYSR
ncbi:MAG: hypothetical protein ACI4JM_06715 [Oscillospiraceae bacterium]